MGGSNITREIESCKACLRASGAPFYFPLKEQPIMLISAAPSMQAKYKPLYSIRFFRNLCIALFGDKYLRDPKQPYRYLREFCDGSIYWTHYRKCYKADPNGFDEIESFCADRFLQKEMDALKGSLKYIIVLGDPIHEKVRALTPAPLQSCLIMMPFPSFETCSLFDVLRKEIAPFLRYFGAKKNDFTYKDKIDRYTDDSTGLEGSAVHLRFELSAFEEAFTNHSHEDDKSIEHIWYKNMVVPNIQRFGKLIQAYSFIENQIRVQLVDYMASTGGYTIIPKFFSPGKSISLDGAIEELEGHWRDAFINYIRAVSPENITEADDLIKKIKTLGKYRNAVVHNGGRMEKMGYEAVDTLPGIFGFAGTVYVDPEGENTLLALVRYVTDFLCKI